MPTNRSTPPNIKPEASGIRVWVQLPPREQASVYTGFPLDELCRIVGEVMVEVRQDLIEPPIT